MGICTHLGIVEFVDSAIPIAMMEGRYSRACMPLCDMAICFVHKSCVLICHVFFYVVMPYCKTAGSW
jgi:hypothetical protein